MAGKKQNYFNWLLFAPDRLILFDILVIMPLAIVSVINDLTTDQRVDRTCRTLVKAGYEVLLVGRQLTHSRTLAPRSYGTHRMRLLFEKGPAFYAEYNLRLFFFLLARRYDLLVSNDLDTLPGSYVANRIKSIFLKERGHRGNPVRIPHLHDCHEYFRGMPELTGRKFVSRCWKWIEDKIFPQLRYVVAVNRSVADLYSAEYGNTITVIRNVPDSRPPGESADRGATGVGEGLKIILYQGAVNVDRGLDEAIEAMKYVTIPAVLVIAGIGDEFERLRQYTRKEGLDEKVRFLGQVPFRNLSQITRAADLGLSIEKDVSLNYHFCLPNKFLDYIQAGVPVLVSPLPEMKAIVDQYQIGEFISCHDPLHLASKIDGMLGDPDRMARYRDNLQAAAADLCWEKEEPKLNAILATFTP